MLVFSLYIMTKNSVAKEIVLSMKKSEFLLLNRLSFLVYKIFQKKKE